MDRSDSFFLGGITKAFKSCLNKTLELLRWMEPFKRHHQCTAWWWKVQKCSIFFCVMIGVLLSSVWRSLEVCLFWAAQCHQKLLLSQTMPRAACAPCALLFSPSQPKGVQHHRLSISDKVCTSWCWTPNPSSTYSPLICLTHKLLDNLLGLCSSRNARWYAYPSLTLCATGEFSWFFLVVYFFGGGGGALRSYIFNLGSVIVLVHYIHWNCLKE